MFTADILAGTAAFVSVLTAQLGPPPVNCTGLPGCLNPNLATLATGIPILADLFVGSTAALAVIAVLYGGFTLLLSNGDEGKSESAKKSVLYGFAGLAIALSAKTLVSFVVTENFGQDAGKTTAELFLWGPFGVFAAVARIGLALFNTILVFVIFYAGVRMIMARGKQDEAQKGVTMLKWAIVGAIMVNLSLAAVEAFIQFGFPG